MAAIADENRSSPSSDLVRHRCKRIADAPSNPHHRVAQALSGDSCLSADQNIMRLGTTKRRKVGTGAVENRSKIYMLQEKVSILYTASLP